MNATPIPRHEATPYQQSVESVLASLNADFRRGLSATEARTRLERDGRNELTAEEPVPSWKKFLAQSKDVLVILLLIATVRSALEMRFSFRTTIQSNSDGAAFDYLFSISGLSILLGLSGLLLFVLSSRKPLATS